MMVAMPSRTVRSIGSVDSPARDMVEAKRHFEFSIFCCILRGNFCD